MNGAVKEALRRLARAADSRFIHTSVYLDTKNDTPRKKDEIRIFLKNQIRDAELLIGGREERELFKADTERILRFVDDELHRTHKADGHAIFACGGEDLFLVVPATRPLRNQFLVSNRPLIRQLSVLLDEFDPVVAVVVDSRVARIFEISLVDGVHETDLREDVPREVKVPAFQGFGDLKYQRDVRGQVEHQWKEVGDHLARLADGHGYRRFVLLGQEALLQNFRKLLPKRVDERVVATCAMDRREARDRVVARVLDIVAAEQKRHEQELVELIRDQALSGNLGVFGLDAVLNALRKGQVYRIAIAEDVRASGWRCRGCQGLSAHLKKDACPYCGSGGEAVELGDEVVKDALAQGAEVETVRGSQDLARMGKIGALLRFKD